MSERLKIGHAFEILSSLLLPVYKLCDIVFGKVKGQGGTVNRTSVYGKGFEGFESSCRPKGSFKRVLWEISQNS